GGSQPGPDGRARRSPRHSPGLGGRRRRPGRLLGDRRRALLALAHLDGAPRGERRRRRRLRRPGRTLLNPARSRSRGALVVVVAAAAALGCEPAPLGGKGCPCAAGYTCCDAEQLCLPQGQICASAFAWPPAIRRTSVSWAAPTWRPSSPISSRISGTPPTPSRTSPPGTRATPRFPT